jgi:DNA-binding CsgD family transcriptional regulator
MGGRTGTGGALLERDGDLERIKRCLQRAQEGQGSALVVEGPAGMGKTALLAAGRGLAEAGGFGVLRSRGAELEREFAFGVVRQLLEPTLARASDQQRASLLSGPPAIAARLLALPGFPDDADVVEPAPPDPSFAVLHGLYWLCVNLAAQLPIALVVDDAHWSDRASLRFLAFLLPRLEELRVAVLLGARPAEADQSQALLAALMTDPATELVRLRPLTTGAVTELVSAGLGAEPDLVFAEACREATGGTPFLLRTLVESLRDAGIPPVQASAARVLEVAGDTVGRWAMLRLAGLGPDSARLARAAAILERAELGQAARLAGVAPVEAASAAALLIRAGVLIETPLSFAHPLVRSAMYQQISPMERAEAHGRAARLLAEGGAAPAQVAEHLLAASPTDDVWVVDRLRGAASEASARGAPGSAAAYLRRALAESTSTPASPELLLKLGLAEYSAGQPDWRHHLNRAVEAAEDDTTRVAAALTFAQALRFDQSMADAVAVCDRVAASLDLRQPEARWRLEATAVSYGMLDAATAPTVTDRARALLAEAKKDAASPHVLAVALHVAALGNQPAESVTELARRAIAAALQQRPEVTGPPLLTSWSQDMPGQANTTIALVFAGSFEEAQASLDAAVAEAQAAANRFSLAILLAVRAWLELRRSDLTAAEADARAVLDTNVAGASPLFRVMASGVLADVLVERGALDEAERQLGAVSADLRGRPQSAAILRHAQGRLRVAQQRLPEALRDFEAAGEICTGTLARSPSYLPWRSDAALAHLALGEPDAAHQLSQEELELSRAFGAPYVLGVSLRAASLVTGGQRGEELLRGAVEVLAGADSRLEHARALIDLGALLRRSNRRVEARDPLRQALDTARRVGAQPLARRAETELRATGAKPRRVLLTGLEALTASERRIAELAALGHTNSEIAQTLFITTRTVEGHLTHVFQKLEVKTRMELPTALAAPHVAPALIPTR